MAEVSRRELFGMARAAAAGVVTGAVLAPTGIGVSLATEEVTGLTTGNQVIKGEVEADCRAKGIPADDCWEQFEPTNGEVLQATVMAPISEELMFRAFPSLVTDRVERRDDGENPGQIMIHGSRRGGFTRGEVIGGAISSLVFGALHNLTPTGFATRNIPASHIVDGAVFWVLQRRLGIIANISAHSALNGTLISLASVLKK